MKSLKLAHLDSRPRVVHILAQPPKPYNAIAHIRSQIDAAYERIAILETGESAYLEAAIAAKTYSAAPALIAQLDHAFSAYRDRVKQVYLFLNRHEQQSVFYNVTMRPYARAKPTRHARRRLMAAGRYQPALWFALDASAYYRAAHLLAAEYEAIQ